MYDWDRMTIMKEHCDDMLRYALNEQMVRQALRQGGEKSRFYCRALRGLGRRLAALGVRLQEQYSGAVESPALNSSRPG